MPDAASTELDAVWQRVRSELRASLPPATYKLWIEPLSAVSSRGETLYLAAPEAIRVWVERRYQPLLLTALAAQTPTLRRVVVVPQDEKARGGARPVAAQEPRPGPVDPAHTFERFVIGPGNRLAHAASLAVAELPGEAYNPFFLHGPPGLGKTHLMGAIAGYLRAHHPDLNVHLTTAERFTGEFVAALRSEGPERFKQRYRELDALLIDDVQVLEGKVRTEEEFVHTFNALHAAGKQIILSSDRPPAALSRLAERLRDRFEWGLTVEIEPPDLRTRINVLWRLVADSGTGPSEPDALREIAGRVPGNVRLLEGALTRALALASIFGEPLDPSLARRALAQGTSSPAREETPSSRRGGAPDVQAIRHAVCSTLAVSPDDLSSPRRTPRVARARQLAMYLTRELTALSLAQIAREFDRDHSTVLYAIRAVEERLEPGSQTLADLHVIRADLRGTVEGTGQEPPRPHDPPDHPHH